VPENADHEVIEGFADEWTRFDQSELSLADREAMFNEYFAVFPWHLLPPHATGFDMGCGSGRWATMVAPKVGMLHCIDPAEGALNVARRNLASYSNCVLHLAGVDAIPLPDASADFGYSLGVLHHIPDTEAGLNACVAKLKPGAPFLVYLYYAFDNRPGWFRLLWRTTEAVRHVLSRSPYSLRFAVSQVIAATVYWPLARIARIAEKLGRRVDTYPLAYYRRRAFYVMRTDALDRFGTRLEKRFTRRQIEAMMTAAGLIEITFSDRPPHWCASGIKRTDEK
jgi:ubiquinone/menaquinone biosynthesis C-methylase UbiE